MSIHQHFTENRVHVPMLAAYLDSLDQATRVREVRTLSGREQAVLFDAAAGVRPIALDDLVPLTSRRSPRSSITDGITSASSTRLRSDSAGRPTAKANSGGTTSMPSGGSPGPATSWLARTARRS